MYKMIILDCDGTLLNSKKELTDKTIKSIKRVIKCGTSVIIASARPYYRLKAYINALGLDNQYTIAFNGGAVIDNSTDTVVYSKTFKSFEVEDIVKRAYEYNTEFFLYSANAIYSSFNDEKYKKKNPDVNFHVIKDGFTVSDYNIYKIAYVNAPEKTVRLRSDLPREFLTKYEASSSVPQFIEFVPKGVNKAEAIDKVCELLKINKNEIIAFGDQENDIPLLEYSGYAVAMGNAPDIVKNIADEVTLKNDEDGVALTLDKLFV